MPTPELGVNKAGSAAGELFQWVCTLGVWRGTWMVAEKGAAGPMQVLKLIAIFLGLIYSWSLKAVIYHLITITRWKV